MIVDFVWESRKWEEELLIQRARVCFKQPSYDGGTSNLAVAMGAHHDQGFCMEITIGKTDRGKKGFEIPSPVVTRDWAGGHVTGKGQ